MIGKVLYSAAEFEALRKAVQQRPLRHYEAFQGSNADADEILRNGWRLSGFLPMRLDKPIAWESPDPKLRSFIFHVQSWDPIDPLLKEDDGAGSVALLAHAFALADDWVRRYPEFDRNSPAWYDMAVGMRAYRLAYLVDLASRLKGFDPARGAAWMSSLETHREVLARDDFFAAHSNHGFYQLCGQLAMGRRFEGLIKHMDEAVDQAMTRLRNMLERQFTKEGIHREHSPDYQRMLLEALRALRESGLVEDPEFLTLYQKVEETLAWFIMPNGKLVNFGDSDYRQMQKARNEADRHLSPVLRYAVSKGRSGAAARDWVRGFPESGYFIARNAWSDADEPERGGFYLAQNLAFHSRTHKHADHMTFVWYDRGNELLIDAGRFGYVGRTKAGSPEWKAGYWYGDRRRMYVESSAAHNTVVIDGKDHERRNAEPFGSALRAWGEHDAICYSLGEVRHQASVRHIRMLMAYPGKWLLVLDWIHDNLKKEHSARQWFHFAPDLAVARENEQLIVSGMEVAPDFYLRCASFTRDMGVSNVYVGADDGTALQGWWSPREGVLAPAPAVAFEANGATLSFVTLFSLAQSLEIDYANSACNRNLTKGRLRWQTEAATYKLAFERGADGQLALSYNEARHKRAARPKSPAGA